MIPPPLSTSNGRVAPGLNGNRVLPPPQVPGFQPAEEVSIGERIRFSRAAVLVGFVALEVAIALVMRDVRAFGLLHLAGVAVGGLYAIGRRNLPLLLCVIAYIPGSEMLWRQTKAAVYYLIAPYMVTAFSLYAVLFVLGRVGKSGRIALLYFALLLPAVITTIRTAGEGARELVAFGLSGPMTLAAFVAFVSQVRVKPWLYRRILWAFLIGTIGPLTIAAASVNDYLSVGAKIEFSDASNYVTSGGTAPVQVSAVLGMGVMAGIILVLFETDRRAKLLAGAAALALAVQSFLTFSRGGMASVIIATSLLALAQSRDRRMRTRILVVIAVAVPLFWFLIFPRLDAFTDGAFQERFTNSRSSRSELAVNDTEIFRKHILFGVGPGMTKYQRLGYEVCQLRSDKCVDETSSHTEFTRMLGEHGIPGVFGLAAMGALALSAYRVAGRYRAFTVAWLGWAVAQMFYANLRVVGVAVVFGFAFLRMSEDPDGPPDRADASSGVVPRSRAAHPPALLARPHA